MTLTKLHYATDQREGAAKDEAQSGYLYEQKLLGLRTFSVIQSCAIRSFFPERDFFVLIALRHFDFGGKNEKTQIYFAAACCDFASVRFVGL